MKANRKRIVGLFVVLIAIIGSGFIYWNFYHDQSAETMESDASLARFTSGPFEVGIAVDPSIPRVGDNQLIIEVRDADGTPISDVNIDAIAEMPAMGAMSAMRSHANFTEVSKGRYEGDVNLEMRGEWPLTVRIKDPKRGDVRLQFDFATDREGFILAAGGTPVGSVSISSDDTGVITIDNRRRQMIGVETDSATHRNLIRNIRAVGHVTYDERRLSKVTLKFDAWVGELFADYLGAHVKKGEVLFTVYSPELLAAQQEYLETLKRLARRGPDDSLLKAARQRLNLWDMSSWEIEALEKRGQPREYVPIYAPASGTIVEKTVEKGSAVKMGETLLRIADLSQVWVEAEVYEADLELIRAGMAAMITLPYLPSHIFEATVDYIYPYLEGDSRTGRIRLNLDNTHGVLKPDMYAEVKLAVDLGHRLVVPEEAVMFAGDSRIVFVDLGEGKLKPVKIKTGRRAQGYIEVLDGLKFDDTIVTSGNFLIASETKLKAGIDQW